MKHNKLSMPAIYALERKKTRKLGFNVNSPYIGLLFVKKDKSKKNQVMSSCVYTNSILDCLHSF